MWQVDLAPQQVEVLSRRGHIGNAQAGVTLRIAADVLQAGQHTQHSIHDTVAFGYG